MQEICKDVGFDGRSFYCMRCGRAGFRSEAAARGHLGQCKGRLISQGIDPAALAGRGAPAAGRSHARALDAAHAAAASSSYTKHMLGSFDDTSAPFSPEPVGYPDYIGQQLAIHTSQIAELRNEYNHMLVRNNPPTNNNDWFGQNKGLVMMVVIVAFIFWTMNQSSCPSNCGESKTGRSRVSSLGEKAAAKLIDRGITKSVDKLFG